MLWDAVNLQKCLTGAGLEVACLSAACLKEAKIIRIKGSHPLGEDLRGGVARYLSSPNAKRAVSLLNSRTSKSGSPVSSGGW